MTSEAEREIREELGKLRERVAVLEQRIAQRTHCPHCGGEGGQLGLDPIGMLRCMKCHHRWWQGGDPA
jgi:ribosomal protein L37AE/L43A